MNLMSSLGYSDIVYIRKLGQFLLGKILTFDFIFGKMNIFRGYEEFCTYDLESSTQLDTICLVLSVPLLFAFWKVL